MSTFDGYVEKGESERRLRKGVFEQGDTWFVTRDIMRRDEDGDFWFVDRAVDVLHSAHGDVASRAIEDALYEHDAVRRVAVLGLRAGKYDEALALIVPRDPASFDLMAFSAFARRLSELERPAQVSVVDDIPLTDGYRPLKSFLRATHTAADAPVSHRWDAIAERYV